MHRPLRASRALTFCHFNAKAPGDQTGGSHTQHEDLQVSRTSFAHFSAGRTTRAVARFARITHLRLDQIRWCWGCRLIAFAVDEFERRQLDQLGFRNGLCPACRSRRSAQRQS